MEHQFKDTDRKFTKKDIIVALMADSSADENTTDSRFRSFMSNQYAKKTVIPLIRGEKEIKVEAGDLRWSLMEILCLIVIFTVYRQRNRLLSSGGMISEIKESIANLFSTSHDFFIWIRAYNQELAKAKGKDLSMRNKSMPMTEGITHNSAEVHEQYINAVLSGDDFYMKGFRTLITGALQNLSKERPMDNLPMLSLLQLPKTEERKLDKLEAALIDVLRDKGTCANSISLEHSSGVVKSFTYEIKDVEPKAAAALKGSTQVRTEIRADGTYGKPIAVTKRISADTL